ncbi:MAG: hypothetical protein A2268_12955 [Candidatus Raymondbacteria bacterium RifOxyA12_full_50_37]|uniref:Outer membrane lipoprotein BamD-like domain-containing protein n=1 Tax=Candidatus Raymondbacteria bacterium RIFOXYD12_FULL_49_13 TaxID=1817890 RepID=A0A1F7EZR6_UNCRA|nr:MAG: hypothetical protein A2268_12955 [Candidatus Raymondbacteria bacterium RifOxyA12_full_50_37]OGJ92975.1 MAG: hypothetical protein A2248_18090 [Candidatus Raymondbacteria bacterium RIFOXYA2_FULL_49_16]OGJ97657.1 MAG: hypothetical protein A2487_13080 [Candidatus Raymondbacteria bacterium RifOxyC12_full_50_8]OGJ99889.1 MAG: hypothetical protein A2519_00070 [Candidatus Raymondbacteria bacterium RIFOXYD12_FULL_49_13]OGP40771.1 MAG: hypothetical protein A2324_03660 [Candidatus Raymondbacteria 
MVYMKIFILSALASFCMLVACNSNKSYYETAQFELQQGNIANAKQCLGKIEASSPYRAQADSLLKSLEDRQAP